MFFLTIGFLIDARIFANTIWSHFGLCAGIVGGLIAAKMLAAFLAQKLFGYSTKAC
jgi:Kef-type K+ transport system membrane component KefB